LTQSSLVYLLASALAVTVALGEDSRPAFRERAESCGPLPSAGDTLVLKGMAANGRELLALRIWSDRVGRLSYVQTGRMDSADVRSAGTVWLDQAGLPVRYSRRDVEGSDILTDSVERTESGVMTVRNGARTTANIVDPAGALIPDRWGAVTVMLLAQCAWHQPGRAIRTYRGDTIRLREALTVRVRRDTASKTLTLFQLTGRGLNSYYTKVWLDEQGQFFATRFLDGADIFVPAAWRNSAMELLIAGGRAAEPQMKSTADAVASRPTRGIVITNARVLDVERGRTTPRMSVFVQGSVIRKVSPDSEFSAPSGSTLLDAKGATLMPGLWDLDDKEDPIDSDGRGRRRLSEGVTTVRMLFADTVFSPMTARRIDDGAQLGPRMILGCSLDGWYPDTVASASPQRRRAGGQVRRTADVDRVVNRCAGLGMRWIMLSDNLPRALTGPAIERAHRLGLRVTGEQLRGRSTSDLVAAGYDQFEHLLQPLSSFVSSDRDSVAWLLHRRGGITTFWVNGAELARLDLHSPTMRQLIATMAQKQIGVTTTLCVYPPINRGQPHDTTWDRAAQAKLQEFAIVLHRAGVPVLVATDGACALQTELALLSAAGFTNSELLSMATIGASRAVGQERDFGSIAVGKRADLVLIDGDPLANLSSLKNVTAVMKDGILYSNVDSLRADRPFLLPRR